MFLINYEKQPKGENKDKWNKQETTIKKCSTHITMIFYLKKIYDVIKKKRKEKKHGNTK